MTTWQPIETAPNGGPDILVYGVFDLSGEPEVMIGTCWQGAWSVADTQCGGHYPAAPYATHWMPLPEPPK